MLATSGQRESEVIAPWKHSDQSEMRVGAEADDASDRQWLCTGGRGQREAEQTISLSKLSFAVNPIKSPVHFVRLGI